MESGTVAMFYETEMLLYNYSSTSNLNLEQNYAEGFA